MDHRKHKFSGIGALKPCMMLDLGTRCRRGTRTRRQATERPLATGQPGIRQTRSSLVQNSTMRPIFSGLLIASVLLAGYLGATEFPPSEEASEKTATVVVHADRASGIIRPVWDEINLWKLYTWFGVHGSDPADRFGEGWLRRRAPWLRYARVVAPLGGSYGPSIAEDCDHRRETPQHPEVGWECGTEKGSPGIAAKNEIMGFENGAWVVDYTPFRIALERLLRSGLRPHLNVSATPVGLTGGEGDFRHYHWNARPPSDLDSWLDFLRNGFESVADLGPAGWRVSIINEPNCLIPHEGEIAAVGYAGNPDGYAKAWTRAVRTIREAAPGIVIHPGNYVTSATFPGEDNLHIYLASMAEELDRSEDLDWGQFPYVGLSLYEVPDTTLADFRSTRLHRLYKAQEVNNLPPLPIKIDEMGIHHDVRRPFEEETGEDIHLTLYSASWYAEALRKFVEAGDVTSSAGWLGPLFDQSGDWRPRPAAYTYWILGMLAGQLDLVSSNGESIEIAESGNDNGLPRLVTDVARHPETEDSSLGALATTSDGTTRVFVVHHQPTLVGDLAPLRETLAFEMEVEIRGLDAGAYQMRHISVGGPSGARWEDDAMLPLKWIPDGCSEVQPGDPKVSGPFHTPANSVWLFEVRRVEACEEA
jgi:hypothetical protein